MEIFKDDEEGYLRWVALNSGGFVLNCERRPSARYLVLHRAICDKICSEKRTNYTSTGYIKVCALEKNQLDIWAKQETGGRVTTCSFCDP